MIFHGGKLRKAHKRLTSISHDALWSQLDDVKTCTLTRRDGDVKNCDVVENSQQFNVIFETWL